MRARIALAVAALAMLVVLLALVLLPGSHALKKMIVAVPFVLVGGLLGAKRPQNIIGWLFLGFGATFTLNFAADRYAQRALVADPGSLLGGDVAASFAAHSGHASFGFFVLAFLLFPNGQLLSPRWRWVAYAAAVIYVGLALSGPFDSDQLRADIPQAEPLVHGAAADVGSAVFGALLLANLLVLILAGVSLGLRLHRARGEERQQIKWFALPVAVTMVAFPVSVFAFGSGRYGVYLFPLIPAAAAVAILRYRLYDIDVVINRALVYTALTATLAAAYLGIVLVLQLALESLTAGSSLAVAASTLAVAALFRPARARIQQAVDHRFFRRRYDAARTLEAFSSRLRADVSLDALNVELRDIVTDTMQPSHVSVWLREAPR